MSTYQTHASGLSTMEKFCFSLARSAVCHSVAMPIHRYGTITQLNNTVNELDAVDYDSITTNSTNLFPSWTDLVTDNNSVMSIYYRTCLLLTSHGTAQVFKEKIKRKINVQRSDKRHIRVLKRVMFSTITRVITFSLGHHFSYMQSMCSINRVPKDTRWRFGFTQRGFSMLCITTMIDQLLWYSSYYWFAPYLKKPIHSKIRTYASNFLIHPLYTIMRRQMLTDETIYEAATNLVQRHGFKALFDGALSEILRSVMYDFCGKTFDGLLKRYVLWKYDVYGIGNTLNLCKEYVDIMERDSILVHGYVRQFVEGEECGDCTLYVPNQLIDLIADRFFHEAEYQIDDPKLHKFACSLSAMDDGKGVHGVDAQPFLADHDTKRRVKRLFEHEKFQKLWKRRVCDEMQQRQRMEKQRSESQSAHNDTGGVVGWNGNGTGAGAGTGGGGGGAITGTATLTATPSSDSGYSSSTINNRYNCYFFGYYLCIIIFTLSITE